MPDEKAKPTITELIDADEGLKAKRKLLTITSLILLALSFSGAKVEEANTFILKLQFEHQGGIPLLLVIAIVFLLIRYYNYAKPYHDKLFREWSDRMLRDSFFFWTDFHTDEFYGLIADLAPKELNMEAMQYEGGKFDFYYQTSFLKRKIVYSWSTQYYDPHKAVEIELKNYPKVYWLEFKSRTSRYLNHRENLDILAPYFIGVLAISSYVFNSELSLVLNFLAELR